MISLDELKQKLIKEYDLQDNTLSCGSFLSSDEDYDYEFNDNQEELKNIFANTSELEKFYKEMAKHPTKVKQIEDAIDQGDNFRLYFTTNDYMRKFLIMHDENPDDFYRILRKEELFLNTCLKTFGFNNCLIVINPMELLENIKKMLGLN